MSGRVPSAVVEGLLYALILAAPLAFGCVEPWSQALLEIGCFVLALLCLFRPERSRPSPLPLLSAGAVLAIGAVQRLAPVSPLDPRSSYLFTVSAFATNEALLLWAAYAALAWSVPRVVKDAHASRRFARAIVASGVLVAAMGTLQKALGIGTLYGLRYVSQDASPFGPYYNRDHAANLMALSFSVALGIWTSGFRQVRSSWRVAPPDWVRAQAATGAALALLLLGLILCASRGAALGLIFGGSIVLFLSTRFLPDVARRRKRQALVVGGIIAGLALVYHSLQMSVQATGVVETSIRDRLSMYSSGLRMLRDSPLFGWGLGAVGRVFGAYQQNDVVGVIEHVHGDWLELALQCGLVGFSAVLLAWLAFSLRTLRVWWRAKSREMRALIGGGFLALLAFAIHCLVDFCSQIPANAALFFALAGWLSGAEFWADKAPAGRGSWPRWRWAFAPVFLCLAIISSRPAIGAWYARQADLAPFQTRGAFLTHAIAWDPRPEYHYLLGLNYYDLGMLNPAARPALLNLGLRYAKAATDLEPLNPDFLFLSGALLWRLGQASEAEGYTAQAQRLWFKPVLPVYPKSKNDRVQADLSALHRLHMLPDEIYDSR